MRPLTYTGAKHLIPVANKPVIFYSIEAVAQAGIRELGIVVSPHREEEFKLALGDGSRWGLKISYILQHQPKGLAHAVSCARDFVGREPFLIYLGDNLLENGVADFVREFERGNANASIVLVEVEDPRSFGVAQLKDGQIIRVIEKPQEPPSNFAIVGVYLFDEKIFEAIREIKPQLARRIRNYRRDSKTHRQGLPRHAAPCAGLVEGCRETRRYAPRQPIAP
jgi:glucose-1-phosphate thymidylyltransferase